MRYYRSLSYVAFPTIAPQVVCGATFGMRKEAVLRMDKGLADVFASDFSHAEIIGKNVRLIWSVPRCDCEGAAREQVPVAQLVVPLDAVRAMVQRLLFAIGEELPACVAGMPSMRLN